MNRREEIENQTFFYLANNTKVQENKQNYKEGTRTLPFVSK